MSSKRYPEEFKPWFRYWTDSVKTLGNPIATWTYRPSPNSTCFDSRTKRNIET